MADEDTSPITEHAQGASQSVEAADTEAAEPEIVVDAPEDDATGSLKPVDSDPVAEDEVTSQLDQIQQSLFVHEGKAAWLMLAFTCTYWTLVVWIPTLANTSFVTPGLFGWCVGFVGLISCGYTLKEGNFPSGATRDDIYATNGLGRYTAILLTGTVIVDFCVLSFWFMMEGGSWADVIRGCCHLIHVFWMTLFFYGKFRKMNPEIATTAFFMEWFDMAISCAVVFVLHNGIGDTEGSEGCFGTATCRVYFAYVVLELFGWVMPMMWFEKWGTQQNGRLVATHLFVLDMVTDVMVVLTVLIDESYTINGLIKFDLIWKSVSAIRSFSYYAVYQIWLDKGHKVFKRTRGHSFS